MAAANYHEFVYVPEPHAAAGGAAVNLDLGEARFRALLEGVKRARLGRPSSRSCKCYVKDALLMDAEDGGEVRVWERQPVRAGRPAPRLLHLQYARAKVPMHAFPCTTAMHHVYHSRALVFRLHNRVFLNFEVQHSPATGATVHKVFVNYNHDDDMDRKTIQDRLQLALRALGVTEEVRAP